MRLSVLLGTVLLVACHHEAAPVTAVAPATIPCGKVADHFVSVLADGKDHVPQAVLDKMAGLISQSCEATAWTEDAKSCALAAKTHEEMEAQCENKLTEPQKADLNQRFDAQGSD
jgi:hypothetical protein